MNKNMNTLIITLLIAQLIANIFLGAFVVSAFDGLQNNIQQVANVIVNTNRASWQMTKQLSHKAIHAILDIK